ncbi:carboxypeptidase-like regulatory domain-containing protein, partial [Sphingobacterium multivorum]
MKSLISLILMMVCCKSVFAQGKYRGNVIDQDHNPIAFATFKLDGTAAAYRTDSLGRFEFSTSNAIRFVTVSALGFETKNINWDTNVTNRTI